MKIERDPSPERAPLTPYRIAGATSRICRQVDRSFSRAEAILGPNSAAWDTLRRRVDTLAAVTRLDFATVCNGVHVQRLVLNMTAAALHASKVAEIARALLGVAQTLEAENASARLIAAELAAIAAAADLVARGIEHNRAKIERHDIDEEDSSVEATVDEMLDAMDEAA